MRKFLWILAIIVVLVLGFDLIMSLVTLVGVGIILIIGSVV